MIAVVFICSLAPLPPAFAGSPSPVYLPVLPGRAAGFDVIDICLTDSVPYAARCN